MQVIGTSMNTDLTISTPVLEIVIYCAMLFCLYQKLAAHAIRYGSLVQVHSRP